MPTYDYKCDHCDHEFEAFQSITDDALTTCPECERNALRRIIGAGAGIIFKGSGFYITDYKRSSSSTASSGSDSAGGDSSD
jgi:putative FmdB family regulatory protein